MGELLSGNRLMRGYVQPGGLTRTPTLESTSHIKQTVAELKGNLEPVIEFFFDNQVLADRMDGIGKVSHRLSVDFGLVGIAARASGLDYDCRKHWSHATYPIDEFSSVHEDTGDVLARARVEFRYALPIPRMFAYVIRRASGRLMGSEFSIAYILSAGVRHFALIGHNDCGMTKVLSKQNDMIKALTEQGWPQDRAEDFVYSQSERHMMKDEIDGLRREYIRLRRLFKNVMIAPMFVDLADTRLFIPTWYNELSTRDLENLSDKVLDVDLISL